MIAVSGESLSQPLHVSKYGLHLALFGGECRPYGYIMLYMNMAYILEQLGLGIGGSSSYKNNTSSWTSSVDPGGVIWFVVSWFPKRTNLKKR